MDENTNPAPESGVLDTVEDAAEFLTDKWERDAEPSPPPEGSSDEPVAEPEVDAQPETPTAETASEAQPEEVEATTEDGNDPAPEVDADAEPEPEPEQQLYTVKVNGEERQVTLDELRTGHMLHADYSRKTQEVAQQRKELEAARTEQLEKGQQQIDQLGYLTSTLVDQITQVEQNTNWDELRDLDPAEYAARRETIRDRKEKLQEAYQAYQQHQQLVSQRQREEMQQTVQEEQMRLVASVPEWSDEGRRATETAKLRDYLASSGFSDDEISTVYDHRQVLMARKAMLYDQLQKDRADSKKSAKAKKLREAPPVKAGAATQTDIKSDRSAEQLKRLRRSGSWEDAADWLNTRMG